MNNVALTIIIFTFVVNLLMMPLTIKQQKFTKLSAVMNPELQKLQEEVCGEKGIRTLLQRCRAEQQAGLYKNMEHHQQAAVFSCLFSSPILFALYRVIYNVPAYVDSIRVLYGRNCTANNDSSRWSSDFTTLMETLRLLQ